MLYMLYVLRVPGVCAVCVVGARGISIYCARGMYCVGACVQGGAVAHDRCQRRHERASLCAVLCGRACREELWHTIDINNDGHLNFVEFCSSFEVRNARLAAHP